MLPVRVFALLARDVTFGKTGDAGGEAVLLADELYELRGKLEAAGRGLEFAAAGRIAAQRENIFTSDRLDLLQQLADLLAGVVDTGEMSERGEVMFALDAIHDHQGLFTRAAAGAIGHGAEVRFGL